MNVEMHHVEQGFNAMRLRLVVKRSDALYPLATEGSVYVPDRPGAVPADVIASAAHELGHAIVARQHPEEFTSNNWGLDDMSEEEQTVVEVLANLSIAVYLGELDCTGIRDLSPFYDMQSAVNTRTSAMYGLRQDDVLESVRTARELATSVRQRLHGYESAPAVRTQVGTFSPTLEVLGWLEKYSLWCIPAESEGTELYFVATVEALEGMNSRVREKIQILSDTQEPT